MPEPAPEWVKENVQGNAKLIVQNCEEVGLALSTTTAQRIEALVGTDYTCADLFALVRELDSRLVNELLAIKFKWVSAKQAEYYETAPLFGERVASGFAKAAYDVEEAGKCLALDRSTACVMHLMRVIEIAIDAIAHGVGVPTVAVQSVAAWEQLLNLIRDRMQANNKASTPPWAASRCFFENAYAYLHAVKDAWRNPSMHVQGKYTPEEAERIYTSVKNLMEHIAEHLNESGVFTP